MTIVEFLEARLAEDDRLVSTMGEIISPSTPAGGLLSRQAREVAAKRAIIDALLTTHIVGGEGQGPLWHPLLENHEGPVPWVYVTNIPALYALASVYADHPDYDQAWGLTKTAT